MENYISFDCGMIKYWESLYLAFLILELLKEVLLIIFNE